MGEQCAAGGGGATACQPQLSALALACCGFATLPRAHSHLRARTCARRYELEPELRVTPFPVNSVKSLRGAIMAIQQHKLVEYSTLASPCRASRIRDGTAWVRLGVAMSMMVWADHDHAHVRLRSVPSVRGREPRHLAGMPRTAAAPHLHPPASTATSGHVSTHPRAIAHLHVAFWIDRPTAAPSAARPHLLYPGLARRTRCCAPSPKPQACALATSMSSCGVTRRCGQGEPACAARPSPVGA